MGIVYGFPNIDLSKSTFDGVFGELYYETSSLWGCSDGILIIFSSFSRVFGCGC
jgi:hypothetical protein